MLRKIITLVSILLFIANIAVAAKLYSRYKIQTQTLIFVGDSMTANLGNFDELKGYLKEYYPNTTFQLLNYGFGATSILTVPDRLEKESNYLGKTYQPINDIPFNKIFIESFGNNPLSDHPLEEGLKLQNQALDKIITSIIKKHPKSSIVFIATVAPNRDRYAEGIVNLTTEVRRKWADERIAYIRNHIKYAKSHNIPLINIYEKSIGNADYISTNDFIHPSPTGIYFISEQLAKFIKGNP
ncbi:SGNH/GDSL hydrolase family protein [Candidatus Daviesbacteria bacterium]|nr:SGNH/GDSL hydrolase family protein [Candidatus Daviesbacteria bacterium]